ncbi:unnamed protein product [Vitrella brassicaformis CCMP3155]|uniref:Uncharacterized protein n=2 Tax=Vitrella brassicaformis TaxID=1169539 RepID=A0A0G4EEL4_VITBC|nr:unnamed protein product [Vitrella brassicaformis CCMP3155]|eukprot:CEL94116.1 unnamed protein product [Vitrella brassicaformis CCMP3155]
MVMNGSDSVASEWHRREEVLGRVKAYLGHGRGSTIERLKLLRKEQQLRDEEQGALTEFERDIKWSARKLGEGQDCLTALRQQLDKTKQMLNCFREEFHNKKQHILERADAIQMDLLDLSETQQQIHDARREVRELEYWLDDVQQRTQHQQKQAAEELEPIRAERDSLIRRCNQMEGHLTSLQLQKELLVSDYREQIRQLQNHLKQQEGGYASQVRQCEEEDVKYYECMASLQEDLATNRKKSTFWRRQFEEFMEHAKEPTGPTDDPVPTLEPPDSLACVTALDKELRISEFPKASFPEIKQEEQAEYSQHEPLPPAERSVAPSPKSRGALKEKSQTRFGGRPADPPRQQTPLRGRPSADLTFLKQPSTTRLIPFSEAHSSPKTSDTAALTRREETLDTHRPPTRRFDSPLPKHSPVQRPDVPRRAKSAARLRPGRTREDERSPSEADIGTQRRRSEDRKPLLFSKVETNLPLGTARVGPTAPEEMEPTQPTQPASPSTVLTSREHSHRPQTETQADTKAELALPQHFHVDAALVSSPEEPPPDWVTFSTADDVPPPPFSAEDFSPCSDSRWERQGTIERMILPSSGHEDQKGQVPLWADFTAAADQPSPGIRDGAAINHSVLPPPQPAAGRARASKSAAHGPRNGMTLKTETLPLSPPSKSREEASNDMPVGSVGVSVAHDPLSEMSSMIADFTWQHICQQIKERHGQSRKHLARNATVIRKKNEARQPSGRGLKVSRSSSFASAVSEEAEAEMGPRTKSIEATHSPASEWLPEPHEHSPFRASKPPKSRDPEGLAAAKRFARRSKHSSFLSAYSDLEQMEQAGRRAEVTSGFFDREDEVHREPVSREVDRPAGGPAAIASLATDEEELLSKLVGTSESHAVHLLTDKGSEQQS